MAGTVLDGKLLSQSIESDLAARVVRLETQPDSPARGTSGSLLWYVSIADGCVRDRSSSAQGK